MTQILIIDDEAGYRKTISLFLKIEGYDVVSCADGKEALEIIHTTPLDLVISDILLPGISGVELLSEINQILPTVPVILITGEPTITSAVKAVQGGAFDYLTKPFTKEALIRVVNSALRVKQLEDENRHHQEQLEELVQQRTRQIANTSDLLKHIAQQALQFSRCLTEEELNQAILKLLCEVVNAKSGIILNISEQQISSSVTYGPSFLSIDSINQPKHEKRGVEFSDTETCLLKSDTKLPTWLIPIQQEMPPDSILLQMLVRDDSNQSIALLLSQPEVTFDNQALELCGLAAMHGRDAIKNLRLSQSLQESENKYRTLSENSNTGIFVHQNGILVYVNEHLSEMLGYTPQETSSFIGQPIFRFFHPESLPQALQEVQKHRHTESGNAREEYRLVTKNGDTVWVDAALSWIELQGHPSTMGNLIDITARKQAEEENITLQNQLMQAQKMEAIGTLAGGIAHDFNNILSIILGNTQMVLMEDIDPESRSYQDLLMVLEAADRAKSLVKQILTFSRRTKQVRNPIQIQPILKEVLRMLRASLPSTIEIKQNLAVNDWSLLADPTEIHQILMNLCTNAAHAMENRGGKLEVKLQALDHTQANLEELPHPSLSQNKFFKLEVSDTGCGMKSEIVARIFEPFFTTKGKGQGTGLGLSVVHGTVKSLGGNIFVDSVEDKGTTFNVYLPITDDLPTSEPKEKNQSLPTGHETLLIVDDEDAMIMLIDNLLSRLGYTVLHTTSSEKAWEMFTANPSSFSLLLTDLTMPKMTGLELSQKILEVSPQFPIMMMSGNITENNRRLAEDIGIRRLILKPFDAYDFARMIRTVIDENKIG